jgi:uncharacterized repeat protein (TIGR04076 family)
MAEWYQLKVTVLSQKGHCSVGHKVGDEFIIGDTAPSGICGWAFFAMFPFAMALEANGSFPWEKDKDITTVACPDSENPVVFELKRIRK